MGQRDHLGRVLKPLSVLIGTNNCSRDMGGMVLIKYVMRLDRGRIQDLSFMIKD